MVTLRVPRHACSPRGVARAGDTWRLVQEAAVIDSEARGWPPDRFKALGTGFVVREMVALHHREPRYSEALPTKTWIAESRRGILMRRETRVADVASCSAEWVHVGPGGTVARASPELEGAFPVSPSPATEFPVFAHEEAQPGPDLQLVPWWTEMDPMGHVNHPRYVDWADEWLARWVAASGLDPSQVVPCADRAKFRAGAGAGDPMVIAGARVGALGDASVFDVRATGPSGLCCHLWIVRRLPGSLR